MTSVKDLSAEDLLKVEVALAEHRLTRSDLYEQVLQRLEIARESIASALNRQPA